MVRTVRTVSVTAAALIMLTCVGAPRAVAQEAGEALEAGEYEPYEKEEFPRWARDLRRFESIFFGSIPFTFFFTSAGYETYAYVDNGYSPEYLPLFLGNSPAKQQFLADTMWQRVAVGLSLSAVVATLDYLLGLGENEGRNGSDGR
jgi:hypothetical protein